jgi:hypothetical protein
VGNFYVSLATVSFLRSEVLQCRWGKRHSSARLGTLECDWHYCWWRLRCVLCCMCRSRVNRRSSAEMLIRGRYQVPGKWLVPGRRFMKHITRTQMQIRTPWTGCKPVCSEPDTVVFRAAINGVRTFLWSSAGYIPALLPPPFAILLARSSESVEDGRPAYFTSQPPYTSRSSPRFLNSTLLVPVCASRIEWYLEFHIQLLRLNSRVLWSSRKLQTSSLCGREVSSSCQRGNRTMKQTYQLIAY